MPMFRTCHYRRTLFPMQRGIGAYIALSILLLHLYGVGYMFISIHNMEKRDTSPFSERLIASGRQAVPTRGTHTSQTYTPLPNDFVPKIYQPGSWDVAPIVVEDFNLLFFTQGKVACTEFKKLMRRMMNLKDWNVHEEPKIPHNPAFNGLKYLYNYPLPQALEMLTNPNWTRAIFVRDPKERFLSAFLDKAAKKKGYYLDRHCCQAEKGKTMSCGRTASRSLHDFITVVRNQCCCDPHWKPQSQRIDPELWQYVNFVGYFDVLAKDGRRMLQRVGRSAWEQFGASGWGKFQNESMFFESSHAKHRTSAHTKLAQYFNDSHVTNLVEDFYAGDYKLFNFTRG